MADDDEVQWTRTLTVRVLRETPEVSGPRGWAEGAIEYFDIKPEPDGSEFLLLNIGGKTYRLSPPVIEAIYDLYQGVPR